MAHQSSIDAVLFSIFFAAEGSADRQVTDDRWLNAIEPHARQHAIEADVIQLSQLRLISRQPGSASLTNKGRRYVEAHGIAWPLAG